MQKKYAAQEDTSWWDDFFIDQENIIDNCVAGSQALETPFTLSIQQTVGSQMPIQAPNVNLDKLLHPQQRYIYMGPRLSRTTESR